MSNQMKEKEYQSAGFSEPAIFVELYLPKKSYFQGTLYDTLTKGFDLDTVKKHFQDKQEAIQAMLQTHQQWRDYSDESIQSIEPFYFGYSIYEVDGVFLGKDGRPIEEKTQVIRFLFRADTEKLEQVVK